MTQELNTLKELVIKMLLEKGCTKEIESESFIVFSIDNKYIRTKYSHYNDFCKKDIESSYCDGLSIELQEVYRNNGTQRNCSVSLSIINWKSYKCIDTYYSTGQGIHRVKINEKFSIKKIEKLVNETIQAYKDAE